MWLWLPSTMSMPVVPLDHVEVGVQPQVRVDDDQVHKRPQQVDVGLRRVDGVERRDAEPAGPLVQRAEAGQVAHADDADAADRAR